MPRLQERARNCSNTQIDGCGQCHHWTQHTQSKRGEWPHVFVIGATDGVMPDHRAWTTKQKPEERNALYVAITRALSTLTILHAPQKILKQHKKYEDVDRLSQFLNYKSVLKRLTKEHSAEIKASADYRSRSKYWFMTSAFRECEARSLPSRLSHIWCVRNNK